MNHIRTQTAEYSRQHPEMPISYAGGYALSTEFEDCDIGTVPPCGPEHVYRQKPREDGRSRRRAEDQPGSAGRRKEKGIPFFQLYLLQCKTGPVPDSARRFGLFSLPRTAAIPVRPSILMQGITDEEKRKEMRRMLDLTHLKECYQKGEESVEILCEYREAAKGSALPGKSHHSVLRRGRGRRTAPFSDGL